MIDLRFRAALCALLLVSCAEESEPAEAAGPQCDVPRVVGRLPAELREASGIAPSLRSGSYWWVIVDDGPAVIFAIDTLGRPLARIPLRGASNNDWEALASARCGTESCLYVGDIGDNNRNRSTVRVYRFVEPTLESNGADADVFEMRYPDGPHDTEAIFVLPDQQLYVLTKGRSEPLTLYRYPGALSARDTVTLEKVQTLSASFVQLPEMITDAGATPDGGWIAVRTYSRLQLYKLENGFLRGTLPGLGLDLGPLHEFQGEGVNLRGDGTIMFVSERGLDEAEAPISRTACRFRS